MNQYLSLDVIDLPDDLLREGTPDVSDLMPTVSDPAIGVFQPVLVRPGEVEGRYYLVAGKRRYTAAKAAGLTQIPAHVTRMGGYHSRIAELVENLARKDLPPHREAEGIIELIRLNFEGKGMEVPSSEVRKILWRLCNEKKGTVESRLTGGIEGEVVMEVFGQLGRSFAGFVSGTLPALSWPADVREAMEGGLSKAAAQAVAQIKDDTMRQQALERIQGGEKAKDVKAEIMGGAAQHRQLTKDLTDAELLEQWPNENGWLLPDLVLDVPEPSHMDVVPRSELLTEMLSIMGVQPQARIVMMMADVSDILAALRYGLKVWSAHTQPRFLAENDETPPVGSEGGTIALINTKSGVYEEFQHGQGIDWAREQQSEIILLSALSETSFSIPTERILIGVTPTASGGNRADLMALIKE